MPDSFFAKITPVEKPERPVDPGFGVDGPPDQIWPPDSLPPLPPGIWPSPPVGVWPPTRPTRPSHPIVIYPPVRPGHGLPPSPGHPDTGLPPVPGHPDTGLPPVPGHPDTGLPPVPGSPDNTLPGTGAPPEVDNTLPMPPATIWPPLPPGTGIAGKALILIWVVGVGYRWLVVKGLDTWPPQPAPPVAQPK
jgi:hypothetical protein